VTGLEELAVDLEGFEWDAGNSEKNWRRHQVTQSQCEQVFANVPLVIAAATKHSTDESRHFALGHTDALRGLALVFTVRGRRILDWSGARLVRFSNLKPSTTTISLRLPSPLLADLKALANKRDVPYQSLLKVFLAERVAVEQLPRVRPVARRASTATARRRASSGGGRSTR